ncbi:hypothetical protein V6N13_125698 [Hibiscus sabdariffa]
MSLCELIKHGTLHVFLSLEIKEWIRVNLTDPTHFAKENQNWDLYFSVVLWNLWLYRNAIAFNSPLEGCASMLERSKKLRNLFVQVVCRNSTVVRAQPNNTNMVRVKAWQLPPPGCYKLNTDGSRREIDG